MSKLPKNLPFNELQIDNIKDVPEMKRWLKTFMSDFRKIYELLYEQVENGGAGTPHWRVIEVSDTSLEFQYWNGSAWVKKGGATFS